MEARAGIEPAIEVLQTSALPLGYLAECQNSGGWECRRWGGRCQISFGVDLSVCATWENSSAGASSTMFGQIDEAGVEHGPAADAIAVDLDADRAGALLVEEQEPGSFDSRAPGGWELLVFREICGAGDDGLRIHGAEKGEVTAEVCRVSPHDKKVGLEVVVVFQQPVFGGQA